MKVLMTVDAVGGVWTYAVTLCRALVPHGVEVVLACMGPPPAPQQGAAVLDLPNVRIYVSDCRLEWMPCADGATWADVDRAGAWLLALAERHRVDVAHLNGYSHAALPWRCPVLVVAHSCVLSWWQAVHGAAPPPAWDEYRERVARGIAAATAVVAPSRFMLQEIARLYGASPHHALPFTTVIPNGSELAAPAARQHTPPGSAERQKFVMACGRMWDEAKNLRALDEAAVGLPWPVYIAGPTVFAGHGAVRCRAAVPLGPLAHSHLIGWLRRAAIFAHPCLYEPFGLAPLEAALAGCPLVLGDVPSLRELWSDAATFIEPRDPDALHDALLELMAMTNRRQQMARAAWARAQSLTPGRMAAQYASLYQRLVAHHVPAGRATHFDHESRDARQDR